MSALTPALKVARLLPLLASDRDGEVVATARAIGRTLAAYGQDWHDLARLISAEPVTAQPVRAGGRTHGRVDWAGMVRWCSEVGRHRLDERERRFLASMSTAVLFGREPSERQAAWLLDIENRLQEARHG